MAKKSPIGVGIVGLGTAFPDTVRTNDWWGDTFTDQNGRAQLEKDVIAGASERAARGELGVDPEIARFAAEYAGDPFRGSRERRVVDVSERSSDLEAQAARAALEDAGLSPADVDLLITFSQVPDYPCPGNHALVSQKLGLSPTVASMTVGADCASVVPHLAVASRLVQCGEYETALVVQGSTSTTVSDWSRPASITVGDGAAAAVVRRIPTGFGYIASSVQTRGEFHAAVRIAPQERSDVPWFRGDEHSDHIVFQTMDAEATRCSTNAAVSLATESCRAVLSGSGYSADDVDFFLCTQATAWFGRACCSALGLREDQTLDTFASYGNLMPANILVNLDHARKSERLRDGDLVLAFTPGAGFILGAMLYRWIDPKRARR